jgi:NTP pyrophosphatase (non-canonical NTP hydrolase)
VDLRELQRAVHDNAVRHGWWEGDRSFGDIIALMHSELSEAYEEFRHGHGPTEVRSEDGKPEGIPIELADLIIRVLDYCAGAGIDLEAALTTKIAFNQHRSYRHGGHLT